MPTHTATDDCLPTGPPGMNACWLPRQAWKHIALVVLVSLIGYSSLIYSDSMDNEFLNWDDQALVVNNTAIRSLAITNITRMFTPRPGATYQPVRLLSYAVDYQIWGLNPVGFQLTNVLLHTGASVCLYGLIGLLATVFLSKHDSTGSAHEIALFAALLFAIHPVNVEPVAWVSGRKYCLLGLFTTAAVWLYLRSAVSERKRVLATLGAIILMILAILSSPLGVIIPALFVLCDWSIFRGAGLAAVFKRRAWVYGGLAITAAVIMPILWRALISKGHGGASIGHYSDNPVNTVWTMVRVLFDYFRNLFVPLWLNCRYVDRMSISPFEPKIIAAVITLLALVVFAVRVDRDRRRTMGFCLGWFFIGWLPASNIIPISTKMADRYIYLSAIGVFFGISLVMDKIRILCDSAGKVADILFRTAQIAIVAGCMLLTIQRVKVWENSVTLWSDSVEKAPDSYLAHGSLGSALAIQGDTAGALHHLQESLRIRPDFSDTHYNLGNVYLQMGDLEAAIASYETATKHDPKHTRAWINLGITMARIGEIERAIENLRHALAIAPNNQEARLNLENALRIRAGQGASESLQP